MADSSASSRTGPSGDAGASPAAETGALPEPAAAIGDAPEAAELAVQEAESTRLRRASRQLAHALAITGRGLRILLFTLATTAALVGAVSMAVGILVWRHADQWGIPFGIIVVVLMCLPGCALPFVVARRTAPLTRAIEEPAGLTVEAKDYLGDVRAATGLKDVVDVVSGPGKLWRPTNLWQTTRLIATFTSRVTPDPKRHPTLAAFTPVYLKTLWLVLLATAWALLASIIVIGFSLIALLAGWAPAS